LAASTACELLTSWLAMATCAAQLPHRLPFLPSRGHRHADMLRHPRRCLHRAIRP
ncbi:hypothetical protein BC831DRAFT_458237, partial [Entophlyctis helioformis]